MFFFFNDPVTTEIYTLSLHDALPISGAAPLQRARGRVAAGARSHPPRGGWERAPAATRPRDRKSTRLNSSHVEISYAVFCLKKKKNISIYPVLIIMTSFRRVNCISFT